MLYKAYIVKTLKEMNLPLSEYWITSGAGLVMHGVKETTRDIDLGCTTNLVEHYLSKGFRCQVADDNSRIVEVNDKIEILENWFVDKIDFIDGLPVSSLESIKKYTNTCSNRNDLSYYRRWIFDIYCNMEN